MTIEEHPCNIGRQGEEGFCQVCGNCSNCNGRKCMDCVTRTMHERCVEDCPVCCEGSQTRYMSITEELVRAYFRGHSGQEVHPGELARFVIDGMAEKDVPVVSAVRIILNHLAEEHIIERVPGDGLRYRLIPEGQQYLEARAFDRRSYPQDPVEEAQGVIDQINSHLA